ncbi:hypothetical protein D039_2436A, partial [Vibrio parahaemolyticus EKP-028]
MNKRFKTTTQGCSKPIKANDSEQP